MFRLKKYAKVSPESPGIFVLLHRLFNVQTFQQIQDLAKFQGFTEDEIQAFRIYVAGFYMNFGNYASYGNIKFIPNFPKEKFERLVLASEAGKSDIEGIAGLWNSISYRIYSLEERHREFGLGPKGTSTYYSFNCDMDDAKLAQEFMLSKNLSAFNTRLIKKSLQEYEIRLASSETGDGIIPGCDERLLGSHEFTAEGADTPVTFHVTRGDYSKLLAKVVTCFEKAKEFATNETESLMMDGYIASFTMGSVPSHKDMSRIWIKNKSPAVETFIAFLECYKDPFGVRGEFEAFVGFVNKEMSAKYEVLVNNTERLLKNLPWPAEYEMDQFLKPDTMLVDLLAYGASWVPGGANIPNYGDIRQDDGFKNTMFFNKIKIESPNKVTFIDDRDKDLFFKMSLHTLELHVGLHELYGHGSGKLFSEDFDGNLNFDINTVRHTETGEEIRSWYKPGETWDTKFPTIGASYEECRAECVALYMIDNEDILRIFGHEHDGDDVVYVDWLTLARLGLVSLEFYTPETTTWRQAHMNARFVILRVLLEAGQGLLEISEITGSDGKPDLVIRMDRQKILTVAKPAIGNFLRKLQVYRSTGDFEEGKKLYDHYSEVTDDGDIKFLSLREIVVAHRTPRKILVQHNTVIDEVDNVALKSYEASPEGMVQSFMDRFLGSNVDEIIEELWLQDRHHFDDTMESER
ncbi:dipeptidyl peptidase 3-like isoform X2 [Dreissena polymorpha]|uniref:dipeptidyl peptidase 3-like isoform X2 n=1 Tax=Dreissena polymorpha TaxID=45954 RepID=UPI002263FFFE|nr:dipeptidyl peptidase 3-like isoform X2 [Dreissena polymorpha]